MIIVYVYPNQIVSFIFRVDFEGNLTRAILSAVV